MIDILLKYFCPVDAIVYIPHPPKEYLLTKPLDLIKTLPILIYTETGLGYCRLPRKWAE